jgi:hypothetical protein
MHFARLAAVATFGLGLTSLACATARPTRAAPIESDGEIAPTRTPSAVGSAAASDESKLAVDIASALPEVKLYCASLEQARQPSRCVLWSEEGDSRLRPVYLGESQPTHTVRFATLHVDVGAGTVVTVDDWVCGSMPLAAWQSHQAKVRAASAGDPPECPDGP